MLRRSGPGRSRQAVSYHGRSGHPVVHQTGTGRRFMMVRASGGGTKRVYEGSRIRTNTQRKGTKDNFTNLKF